MYNDSNVIKCIMGMCGEQVSSQGHMLVEALPSSRRGFQGHSGGLSPFQLNERGKEYR